MFFVLFLSGLLPVKTFSLPSFSCEFYTPLSSFEAKSTPRSELGLLAGDLGLPRLADWGGVQVEDDPHFLLTKTYKLANERKSTVNLYVEMVDY